MKKIIIKEIRMLNFKGIRDLKVEFREDVTTICGRNASGKTTVFDAFTWLLFGKDSQGRKAFNLKTLDRDGNAIPKLPHEVGAVLTVDGERVELCRRFNEKWQKKRGETEETFMGHEEERIYNGVPLSLKEWNEKIAAICPEQVFKFVTNPKYFVSQKSDVQRAMLFRMAGEVSDADIAAGNDDFAALLASLTGKTMEEYKREIQARKRRIKAEIEAIPDRIDERKRDIASLSGHDYDAIEKSIAEDQKLLSDLESEILDLSKKNEAVNKQRMEAVKQLGSLKEKKLRLEFEIEEQVTTDYRKAVSQKNEIQSQIAILERNIIIYNERLKNFNQTVEDCKSIREKLVKEWRQINAETISFNEADFICPTCKRPLDIDDIERKQQEMTENFNADKSARLQANNVKGQANKSRMEDAELAIKATKQDIEKATAELEALKASEAYNIQMEKPDARPVIEANAEYQKLTEEVSAKESELSENENAPRLSDDEQRKNMYSLKSEVENLKRILANRDIIKRNNERIAELEAQYKTGAQELADLERTEFTIAAFNKARTEAIDRRINGLFSLVKFKLYEKQINGGEVEMCEAVVDGVPYSGQNNAMQINMGIDIINAICRFEGITAPVIIDNAESVNELLSSDSQVIRLVVTEDEELTIKQ